MCHFNNAKLNGCYITKENITFSDSYKRKVTFNKNIELIINRIENDIIHTLSFNKGIGFHAFTREKWDIILKGKIVLKEVKERCDKINKLNS